MDLIDFENFLEEYDVYYKNYSDMTRGSINYSLKRATINPKYNDDGKIASELFMYHYLTQVRPLNLPSNCDIRPVVTNQAHVYYTQHRKGIEKLITKLLKDVEVKS